MYLANRNMFDVESRLYELLELNDGWYDGEQGRQLSEEGIAWLVKSWRCFSRDDIPSPCFFPTIEGKIQIEWSFEHIEVILNIDLQKRSGNCLIMDMTTGYVDNDVEISFDFTIEQEWIRLFEEIRRLSNQ